MYKFTLIILFASFAFTVGSTDFRYRRSPNPTVTGLPNKHQDYDHTSRSVYSVSYDENRGGVYTQRADGSLYDQSYDHKKNATEKEQFNKKFGNLKITGPDATNRIVQYNQEGSENERKKDSSSVGHKDIITAPVLVRGPDGTLVSAKAQPALHHVYDHKAGEESKDTRYKNTGKEVDTSGGDVNYNKNYDESLEDSRKKDFKENIGNKIVRDEGGNFSNTTYNQHTGKIPERIKQFQEEVKIQLVNNT